MKNRIQRPDSGLVFVATGLMFFLCMPFGLSAQTVKRRIQQTAQKISVDGDLKEWEGTAFFPVNLSPDGDVIEASSDITVEVAFTFDAKRFYAAVRVRDDRFEFPSRSWRYGDGLLLTLVEPGQEEGRSERFSTYGFSRIKDEPSMVLLNRNGVYFPPASLRDVELAIEWDERAGTQVYEISIPFTHLDPFRPLIQGSWGINLTYADRDQGDRDILQLYPDPRYDSERFGERQGEVFDFVPQESDRAEVQAVMSATHYYDDAVKSLTLGINNPGPAGEWTLRYNLSSSKVNRNGLHKATFETGSSRYVWDVEDTGEFPSGAYVLSVGLIDPGGALRFTQDNNFFVLNRTELEDIKARFAQVAEGKPVAKAKPVTDEKDVAKEEAAARDKAATKEEAAAKGEPVTKEEAVADALRFRNSLPSIEIRFQWIEDFMSGVYSYADMDTLHQWYDDLEWLMEQVEKGEPALILPGRIGRLAHRSGIDGTLQPYSVYVPDFISPEESLPLYVTLHGSGVDEQFTIRSTAQQIYAGVFRGRMSRMIILAPQGRGLSDWYVGNAERDVLECIAHVQTLYKIDADRIILDGFSMGGYGAWRLGLRYPDMFKAVVVRSGAVTPPSQIEGGNILDLMQAGVSNSYLIVHGDADDAVSVENARVAVNRLKALGIDHKYIEIKGGAHGGYEIWDEIFAWLRQKVKGLDAGPLRTPPRKRR